MNISSKFSDDEILNYFQESLELFDSDVSQIFFGNTKQIISDDEYKKIESFQTLDEKVSFILDLILEKRNKFLKK